MAGESAFGLVLVAGPDAVTVTVSDEFRGGFSMMGILRTMTLNHMLVKI